MKRVIVCFAALVFVFALAGCGKDKSAGYPARPVNLIVPFPAGGSSDMIARVISERAARALGQPIVVENRPGAGGNVGTEAAAHAAPDGYTLVQCTIGTCAINLAIYKNVGYDLDRDFQPIVLFASISNILAVHPSVPARSVADLIAHAKKNPGKLSFGSSGYGSSPHLSGELLKIASGTDILHIPYRGSAPAITDLRGGQIDMFFDNSPSILPHIKSGDLRALAVTGTRRLVSLPDIPTMEEAGYPGFVITPWFGLMTQKKTPAAVVEKLNYAFGEALTDIELLKRLATMEVTPGGGTPAEFAAFIDAERNRWGDLVKARGIQAEELQ
ncbi:MAG: tripartite tricarboxylate transporter substrate binding protein [Burkholderiales bacterium]